MTWTLNMALHREVAARVRSSGDGMQQADAAAEIRQLLGAPRLVLLRDGVDVVSLSWSEAMVNLGESLGTPMVAPSGSVADADIDSGTWVARLESADGEYYATTDSVGKSGADVIVADDIDSEHGVSVSITLAMDDDLSSGGAPEPEPEPEPDPERDLRYYPFRADSPWNTKIPQNAIWHGTSDPRTSRVRSNSGGTSGSDTDPGTIVWALNFDDYTFYTWYASNSDPLVTINSGGQSWQVRCPSNAVPSTGTDMHMCIIDPDGLHSHDMYGAQRSGNTINTAAYIKTRLDGMGWRMAEERLRTQANPRGINFDNAAGGRGGPRAVSAAALGGLIRRKHLDDGVIPHALAFACPRRWAKGGIGVRVWPADEIINWGDSDNGLPPYFSGDIPYSTRFGLDKNVNVASLGLSREWAIIAKALQDYGMYLVDVAGPVNPCLYAEYPLVKQAYPNLKNQQTTSFNKIIPHMMALDWT